MWCDVMWCDVCSFSCCLITRVCLIKLGCLLPTFFQALAWAYWPRSICPPNSCLEQLTAFKAFTVFVTTMSQSCGLLLTTLCQPFHSYLSHQTPLKRLLTPAYPPTAKLPHSHLSHQTPLNRLLTPAYIPHCQTPSLAFVSSNSSQQAFHSSLSPRRPDTLIRICLIKLLSTGFSLQSISPTARLPHSFVSSNSSQQASHSGLSPPLPNSLTCICLIKLLSISFSPLPTLPLPNSRWTQSLTLIDLSTSVDQFSMCKWCKFSISFVFKCDLLFLIFTGTFGLLHK